MIPTNEILERINQNSRNNKEEIFTRLFRYLLREDIYYIAYNNLYANNGAGTKGIDNDTADGFSVKYINNIIDKLKNGMYEPKPVRRTYIKKSNGRLRPLGLPTFTDKLIQEIIRMILEAVYEPVFLPVSHGFRPNRSCHTALTMIKKEFNGTKWFIEGDIKGCFDNINHKCLLSIIEKKIKDARLLQLIQKFLKAGYLEDWQYHRTYSGAPQGSIISPILANIYLHELDNFVMQYKKEFDKEADRKYTVEYNQIRGRVERLSKKIKTAKDEEKAHLLEEWKKARKIMMATPSKSETDKKIKYVRYADDFLVSVNGSKEDCENIKELLKTFIANNLQMELSDEKTVITHSGDRARFLGYDITVRRNQETKPSGKYTKRTLNGKVQLLIPFRDKIEKFLFSNGIVEIKNNEIRHCKRKVLLTLSDLEIVNTYNSELRGLCNYYSLASNYYKISYFAYLMEYSCLKTLAGKHRTTVSKIIKKYSDGLGNWAIPYKSGSQNKRMYFAKYQDCKNTSTVSDIKSANVLYHLHSTTKLEDRLKANFCELCGKTGEGNYEIHHVNKVKNLQGKALWEQIMIAKNRKTIVVCKECHKKIHN
jgi:group II intron reverse transcriptase/maturase